MAKSDGNERQRQQGKQQQLGDSPRRDDGAEQAPGSRATQGNLGTTQREWSNRDNLADTDEA